MYRILIVEDHIGTLYSLKELFYDEFEDIKVDTSDNIDEAIDLVTKIQNEALFYDISILDLMLPKKHGGDAGFYKNLILEIRDKIPETFIVCITSFPDQVKVFEHLTGICLDMNFPRVCFFSKLDDNWPEMLISRARMYLYSNLITNKLNALYRKENSSELSFWSKYNPAFEGRTLTYALADLTRDIIKHWDDLDDRLQRRIKEKFDVDTLDTPIRISLSGSAKDGH